MPATTSLSNPVCYEDLIAEGDPGLPPGRSSTRTPPAACATPAAPRATPRAFSIPTAPTCCTASCARWAMRWRCRAATSPCRSCRCSTPMPGRIAFSAPISGAALVMPGPKLDGASIYEMLNEGQRHDHRRRAHRLAHAAATIWSRTRSSSFPISTRVVIGGSACPESIMKAFVENYDTDVIHAWGMTEMSPIGSLGVQSGRAAELAAGGVVDAEAEAGPPALHGRHEDHR